MPNQKTESSKPVYAGAVVQGSDGKVLCQLRDDKPEILFPGHWTSCPGGHVEPGEDPRDAVVRELREEFEIEVTNLQSFITIDETEGTIAGTYHVFTATLATPLEMLKCNEGQRAQFFDPKEVLGLKLHPVSRKIHVKYLSRLDES